MTPDVNVLVAASRGDHPHHAVARAWLEQSLAASASGAAFTLMPMVLASFLRLVTSPKIFKLPTPVNEAVAFVDALYRFPACNWRHWVPSGLDFGSYAWISNLAETMCPMHGSPRPLCTTVNTWSASIGTSRSSSAARS